MQDSASTYDLVTAQLLRMERGALERWCKGDPSGFLEMSAPDVVYFDPFRARRVDGRDALSHIYEELRGKISAARFEILNPLVQQVGEAAVLTYNFVSYGSNGGAQRWNCTEVFRRSTVQDQWELIQSHWSFTGQLSDVWEER